MLHTRSFSRASLTERLSVLFDQGMWQRSPGESELMVATGRIAGRDVVLAATDPTVVKGTLGVAECDDCLQALRRARKERIPLILLIDSAGARLNEGLPIQGALRRLVREALDTHLAGLPIIAALGRHAFGAASMLAFAARQRLYSQITLLAMSGPRVLQAAGGAHHAVVVHTLGGASRCAFGGNEQLLVDSLDAYVDALRGWIAASTNIPEPMTSLARERTALRQRVTAAGLAPQLGLALEGDTLVCRTELPLGAAGAIALAELAGDAAAEQSVGILTLLVDCPSHSVLLADEKVILSQYLAYLALSLRSLVRKGWRLRVRVGGEAAGGVYIAFAAAASELELAPGGVVRTLPRSALANILGDTIPDLPDRAHYVELGVVDRIIPSLVEPPLMEINSNFFALVESRIRERTAALFVETEEGRRLTYGDMLALSARYANTLASLGVVKGDRVAAQVEKSPEAYCLYLAVLRTGAIYVPLNTAYQSAELEYFLRDAEPRVFVCSPADERRKGELAEVAHCLTLDEEGRGSLSELSASQPKSFDTATMAGNDVAAIIYTSGTTGRPKGAMLTHGNLASNGEALTKLWSFTADDVLLHALPLFHAHGLFISCHCALLSGSRILFAKKFRAETLVDLLPPSTVMMGVPTFYTRLLDSPGFTAECVRGMRLFISGSAPLLAETNRQFAERTGHVILERYGMTESVIITSNPFQGERRIGTVGKPVEGVDVRIADGDDNPVPAGTMGGIQIRGTGVMKGYWRMPEKTAEEFTADGWFRTGDLGVLSEDGYLRIVGRSKDLIISGGYNVYPKEVELAIDALPGVAESAVIGVPHRDYGEAVTAVVVRRDTTLTGENIIHTLKGRLASYKVPKQIHFVDELPRNPMGKVLKNVLRDIYGRNGTAS